MSNTKFLQFMEECGVLIFGDFTLKSGRKSPYFINTGEYKNNSQLRRLGEFYADMVVQSGETFNVLYGPAYKGIPLAVIVGDKLLDRGMKVEISFNRKEAKDHGDGKPILGYVPKEGDRIAIIEDVTTAGTSIRETISLLESIGLKNPADCIKALYISIDRMERGNSPIAEIAAKTAVEQIKAEYGIPVYSISKATDIIEHLENNENNSKKEYADKMREYLKQYGV